jgi:hypothetical protein
MRFGFDFWLALAELVTFACLLIVAWKLLAKWSESC